MIFICHPRCKTCQRAQKWIKESGFHYKTRNIDAQIPSVEELRAWYEKSGLPLSAFFNAGCLKYRSLYLEDKLPTMPEDAQLKLLASDALLITRPLMIMDNTVLVGFQPEEWRKQMRKG